MTSLSLGPHYRGRLGTVLHFAHYVSATYPSARQVLKDWQIEDLKMGVSAGCRQQFGHTQSEI